MTPDLDRLEARLGHRFADRDLLTLALTHRSASRRHNNERLEFLGDSLLSEIISVALFRHHADASEGQLTRMRASLVRGQTLAQLALTWLLRDDRVTSALIGARTVEQLDDSLDALKAGPLSGEEIGEIDLLLG